MKSLLIGLIMGLLVAVSVYSQIVAKSDLAPAGTRRSWKQQPGEFQRQWRRKVSLPGSFSAMRQNSWTSSPNAQSPKGKWPSLQAHLDALAKAADVQAANSSPNWVRQYGSGLAPGIDRANAIAVDGAGNVYVTGGSSGSPFSADYFTIKYNTAGNQLWTARYNGPSQGDDIATALAVDAAGNVYVTGFSYGAGTSGDYTTLKYNSSGVQQWAARYNGPVNGPDLASSLAVDAAGNVYVTGASFGAGAGFDYATVKYNSAGAQQWVARYNGPANLDDQASRIALSGAGNIYIAGQSENADMTFDYATIKYNAAGVQQWIARYDGPANSNDEGAALAVDGAENVYVTGGSESASTSSDYATIKYNSAGTQQWVARYDGPDNDSDAATALTLDGAGNVYVTGTSSGSGTGDDYATIKYNTAGVEQWVARYNGPPRL